MADISPLLCLRLLTPALELRLPTDDEISRLARLAREGIHPPDEMPFLVPWTDGVGLPTFEAEFAAFHHGLRDNWSAENWAFELGVFAGGRPIGVQSMRARSFAADRMVVTGSWLGKAFQGHGHGTEMRAAVVELAFAGLGATAVTSSAFERNRASARVSEKLGYTLVGEEVVAQRGATVRRRTYRLDRADWEACRAIEVKIEGLGPCLSLFGAAG